MATILDQSFSVGVESTYGTAVALSRAYEAKADGWKRQQEDIPSVGMRPGMQGEFSDRQKTIEMGATGSTEFDVLNKGMGLLFQGMLGTSSGPTQQAATTAYTSTFSTSTADPAKAYTTQIQRVDTGGTARAFTHRGSVITGWRFSHQVGGLLMCNIDWDAQTSVTNVAAGTAVSPTGATTFDWTQLSVTIDSGAGAAEFCVDEIELDVELGLKTDRRLMCSGSGGLKKQPKRVAVPTITGNLVGEFEDLTEYGLFTAGTICDIVMTWTGAVIESPYNFEVEVTMPACKFTGDTPESSLTEITKQPLPFRALYDGTNPMCTITYTSTDTAL